MSVHLLGPAEIAELRALPFTYADVGATAGSFPVGYHGLSRTRTVDGDFDRLSTDLLLWQVQSRAGIAVRASSGRVEPDAVVVQHIGVGRLAVTAPCRVVYVVDEPDRCGFAYGTLPGHPESGEEAFVLRRREDGRVDFTVSAFSRPATWLTRLGGPVGRLAQRGMTERYLRTLG